MLSSTDAEAVHAMHLTIFESIAHASFMYPRNEGYFRAIAEDQGRLIGAYCNDRLVGYSGLRLPGNIDNSHWRSLGRLSLTGAIAEGAGSGVVPEFRDRGIFRKLIRRRNIAAKELGAHFQTSIVAPLNFASLVPLLQEGFIIGAPYEDESGQNYLLVKPLGGELTLPMAPSVAVSACDVASNLVCLCQRNMIGVPEPNGNTVQLRYHRIL
jgi:hypothetical protein